MENVSSALKMASAMLLFMLALSAFFFLVAKIKNLSDSVLLHSDYTNFYQWTDSNSTYSQRIVDENTVIATLYSSEVNPTHVYIKRKNGTFIYRGETDITLQELVKNDLSSGKTYTENVVEVNISGQYRSGSDGTRVALKRGNTETYIVYTQTN